MADRVVVYEHRAISVWCYPDKGMIHHQIHEYVFGKVFQEALGKGIEALRAHRGTKWLSDDRKNGALPPSDLEWADKVWFPKTVLAGWRYWALVPPENVLGQLNIQRHIKMYKERGITVDVFAEPNAALRWLETRP